MTVFTFVSASVGREEDESLTLLTLVRIVIAMDTEQGLLGEEHEVRCLSKHGGYLLVWCLLLSLGVQRPHHQNQIDNSVLGSYKQNWTKTRKWINNQLHD